MDHLLLLTLLLATGAAAPDTGPDRSCAREVRATATAFRLSELPPEIRDDLNLLLHNDIGDRGAPLLGTDAPRPAEQNFPTTRFFQALLVSGEWFVQFEVSMFAGVRTLGYVRGSDGRFRRWPMHDFGGPACETIRAVLRGVTTPGGFRP